MKKSLLFAFVYLIQLSLFSQTASQGFFLTDWQAKTLVNSTYIVKPNATAPPTTTVTIDAANVITKVSKYVYGHNAGVWGGKINQNTNFMNTISNLSPNVIRWPGGNMSNDYFWNATSQATCPKDIPPPTTTTSPPPPSTFKFNDQYYGANQASWTMSLDNYYDMLSKTNSEGLICVNYAYARYGTSADPVMTAAKYAADWVRYDNGRTKYWEIGNENYGSWETGYEIDQSLNKDGQPKRITGDLYGKHAAVFISEMKKAAAEIGVDIKIGVVLFHNQYDITGSVLGTWNSGVIPHIASTADYLILHNYYTGKNETVATILNSALKIPTIISNVGLTDLNNYSTKTTLPIALTEWNINAEGKSEQISFINGMHATLNLGEIIKSKIGLANRWDFLNGYGTGDNHGLFANGETDATQYNPRAPFYYMYYFQKTFGDKMVASTVNGSADINCYASTFTSGQSGVILVNKGTTNQTVDLKFNNFNVGTKYRYYILTGGSDTEFSRKVYVNGQTTTEAGGGPLNYATLQPFGTDILNNSILISLPKYSVVYLVVENNTTPTCIATITSPSNSFCTGGNVVLTASTGTSYKWFNGTTQVGTAATYTATTAGSYSVEVTNAAGCKATSATRVITVNALPVATITSPVNSFCTGGNVLLTASTGASYKWFNGTAQVGTAATYTATTAGSYTVEVTNAAGCKATSATKVITVNALPVATITSLSNSFCTGGNVLLTASTGASYKWFNGTTQVGTAATYTASAAGSYTVEVTNAAGCKATSATKIITVNALPVATTTSPVNSFCAGGNVLLTASAGASYKWFNGTIQVGTAATYTATTAGSYTVEVTNASGCKATSATKVITVNALPVATITSPTNSFCAGGAVLLTSSTGTSYKWFNGTTQVGTAATYTAPAAGSYTVEVTNASGCKATSTVKVITVNPLPVIEHHINIDGNWTAVSQATVCEGSTVTFGPWPAVSAGWSWTGPNGLTSTFRELVLTTIQTNQSGSYTATYTDPNGCKASSNVTIQVSAKPIATIASPTNSFCAGGAVLLTSSTGTSYKWFNGTTQVGTAATYTATAAGSYTVEVTNTAGCKSTSAAKIISVTPSTLWYADTDNDGKGDPSATRSSCTKPAGYVAVAGDACPTDANKTVPGNCGCNKTENSCLDCAGIPNGTAAMDACMICSGGTTGITPVTNANQCGITTGNKNTNNIQGIQVSPNPFSEQLELILPVDAHIQLIDANGQLVFEDANVHSIQTSGFANGLYLLRIITPDGISILKVIKH